MTPTAATPVAPAAAPIVDHRHLPETDGSIVHNFQEHPQSELLTGSLRLRLAERSPNGQFVVGHDSGIYYLQTDPPLEGCKAPDWFFVSGVPALLDGDYRRSYVIWREGVLPLVVMEYVSGDGAEEHDTTPLKGKFWVYERAIRAIYYVIFDSRVPSIELFKLVDGSYVQVSANAAGRYPIEALGIELGLWRGTFRDMPLHWMRAWDSLTGDLLPSTEERAEAERRRAEDAESVADFKGRALAEECERAETERRRADEAVRRADILAERLRSLGINPDKP